jgi:hypothetical protein
MTRKASKWALKCLIVEKFPEKQEEDAPKVKNSSKEFLAFVDVLCVCGPTRGNHYTKPGNNQLMGYIEEGLGTIGSAPSGGSAKVTIKARLRNSFARKETKTK